jgi:hypothetical protein
MVIGFMPSVQIVHSTKEANPNNPAILGNNPAPFVFHEKFKPRQK